MIRRLLVAGFASPLLFGAWLLTPGSPARPQCAFASGAHHVAVVVEHGNGAVLTRCVAFDSSQLTGEQVMQMSGIEYGTSSYGGGLGKAVCQVDGEPTSYPPNCLNSTSPYWAMFVSPAGGNWSVAKAGISSQEFADGDALGWHYVPQVGPGGGPPPSPVGVCPAPAGASTPPVAAPKTAPTSGPAGAVGPAQPSVGAASPATTPATGEVASPSPDRATSAAPAGLSGGSSTAARTAPASPTVQRSLLAAAGGVGGLLGLLILQLVKPRLRR